MYCILVLIILPDKFMKLIANLFITVSCISTMCAACISETCDYTDNKQEQQNKANNHTIETRSGNTPTFSYTKLSNPYTLDVMQKIYDDYSITPIVLQPTDLYVCFMPQDSTQFRALYDNYNLELFNYPLDIILEEGEEFINPELDADDLPWLYTTVKPDFNFPDNILYEILDTCYIPSENETIARARSVEIDVEAFALGRTGFDIDTLNASTRMQRNKIKPSGTIEVCRDSSFAIPVKGVKVRCNNVVKWDTCYTNTDGQYTMDKTFKTNVHYAIVFENQKDFDIWGNMWPVGRANYNLGWKKNTGCSATISRTDKAWEWAAVNNAAYDYYLMCEETGISKPPQHLKLWVWKNSTWRSASMLRRVYQDVIYSPEAWLRFFQNFSTDPIGASIKSIIIQLIQLVLPDINIGTDGETYLDIYRTTNHELSHASHYTKVGTPFWSRYILYTILNLGYGDGTKNDAELCGIGEMWGYAMGHIQLAEYKGDISSLANEKNYPGGWIKPQVFMDLYLAKTLTKKQIYDCLTPSVSTYDGLISSMTHSYPSKADSIALAFVKHEIVPNNVDVCTCPPVDSVKINEGFEISWAYANNKSLYDIEFKLLKETYFDGTNPKNIKIEKNTTDKCSATITLLQPGFYIIEASAIGSNEKRYFHVAKHYKPSFSLPKSEQGDGQEPVTKLGSKTGSYTVSVSFGEASHLQQRIVALTKLNYRQMTDVSFARRVDIRYVYAATDTLKCNSGTSSTVDLPELHYYKHEEVIYDPVDTNIEFNPQYFKYTTISQGYYTLHYPDDICKWIQ